LTPSSKSYTLPGSGASGGGGGSWLSGGQWGGSATHEPFTGAWQQGLNSAAAAGPLLLANSAVFACTNVISSDIAVLPVQILRDSVGSSREPHYNHPAWGLMQNPNFFQTSLQFIQHYMASKLVHGNTFVLLMRDARYVVNEMFVLNPTRVQPLVADDGSIFYRIGRDVLSGVGDITVPARDILHDRMISIGGHPLVGVSPLFAAGMSAMMAGRMELASEQFFANMSRTSGILIAPGKIDPVVARKLQAEWEQNYSGKGLGRTAVLTNGLDYKPMTVNAADSEIIAQLRWTVENIARVYNVPGHKIGEMNKATYRNSEQMSRDYVRNCLGYHIRSFEQCFQKALGIGAGVYLEFDLSDLYRMEADLRYAAYDTALKGGWMTINEVRAKEDMPPVAGGDMPRVQMQSVPLALADALAAATIDAKPAAPAPAPAAPAPAPAPKPDAGKQLDLDFSVDPVQMDLLVAAFGENFDLGENNGA
jgi:HK97 family phage portal protein